ncbi:MAG: RibD family protein [Cyanobacteria bacterium J007]|nr:MAG: RibD family protein [Cyanobacteria bacterium J007]
MTAQPHPNRPHTTVVLAMSADGKIADARRSPVLFGSPHDKAHLERQVALADAVLGGAGTLRTGGTAMRVLDPDLLDERQSRGKPPQPVQIVASGSGNIDPDLPFFQQPIPRWLVSTQAGATLWRDRPGFDRLLVAEGNDREIDWAIALAAMAELGIERLAVLGGGQLVGSLLSADVLDELWLTVCPLLVGGMAAPTPVDGEGLLATEAKRLELLDVRQIEGELFLHYRLKGRTE